MKLYQSDRPVLCTLHNKMSELYKDLLYCYMRPCNNPTSINPSNNAFFLPIKDVYLGVEVANLLNKPEILQNEVMVEDIKKRCKDFFIVSCCQIKMRLTSIIRYLSL